MSQSSSNFQSFVIRLSSIKIDIEFIFKLKHDDEDIHYDDQQEEKPPSRCQEKRIEKWMNSRHLQLCLKKFCEQHFRR